VSKWRGLRDTELDELQAAAKDRAALTDLDVRRLYKTPDAAESSIAGALYWAWTLLRQDKPAFITIAVIALLWQSLRLFAGLFGVEFL